MEKEYESARPSTQSVSGSVQMRRLSPAEGICVGGSGEATDQALTCLGAEDSIWLAGCVVMIPS